MPGALQTFSEYKWMVMMTMIRKKEKNHLLRLQLIKINSYSIFAFSFNNFFSICKHAHTHKYTHTDIHTPYGHAN